MKKSKKHKGTNWLPPANSRTFFDPESDTVFRAKHPIGYWLLILLIVAALLLPNFIFVSLVDSNSNWMLLGLVGGLFLGIGLCNIVTIIIRQYLGHIVTLVCFAAGGLLMLISWLLCR